MCITHRVVDAAFCDVRLHISGHRFAHDLGFPVKGEVAAEVGVVLAHAQSTDITRVVEDAMLRDVRMPPLIPRRTRHKLPSVRRGGSRVAHACCRAPRASPALGTHVALHAAHSPRESSARRPAGFAFGSKHSGPLDFTSVLRHASGV